MSVLIYAAGAMDDVSKDEAQGWRHDLGVLVPDDCVIVSPAHAYFNVKTCNAEAADRANRALIRSSDLVVANLSIGRCFGTAREIEYALNHSCPVIAFGEVRSLLKYDMTCVDTIEDAVDAVKKWLD